jgi:hypothetical protein
MNTNQERITRVGEAAALPSHSTLAEERITTIMDEFDTMQAHELLSEIDEVGEVARASRRRIKNSVLARIGGADFESVTKPRRQMRLTALPALMALLLVIGGGIWGLTLVMNHDSDTTPVQSSDSATRAATTTPYEPETPPWSPPDNMVETWSASLYQVHNITDGGGGSSALFAIRSNEELQEYYAANQAMFDVALDSYDGYTTTTVGEWVFYHRADDDSFADSFLVFMLFYDHRSVTHAIHYLTAEDGVLTIHAERFMPVIPAGSQAGVHVQWFAVFELSNDYAEHALEVSWTNTHLNEDEVTYTTTVVGTTEPEDTTAPVDTTTAPSDTTAPSSPPTFPQVSGELPSSAQISERAWVVSGGTRFTVIEQWYNGGSMCRDQSCRDPESPRYMTGCCMSASGSYVGEEHMGVIASRLTPIPLRSDLRLEFDNPNTESGFYRVFDTNLNELYWSEQFIAPTEAGEYLVIADSWWSTETETHVNYSSTKIFVRIVVS